jgi:hypothetical protein
MAKQGKSGTAKRAAVVKAAERSNGEPESLPLTHFTNLPEFVVYTRALGADLLKGAIKPGTSNGLCNIYGKMLKGMELHHKYGGKNSGDPMRLLAQ